MAEARIARGESYVAGAAALNVLAGGSRLSQDLDLFHDTAEAVATSWQADRALLLEHGYEVAVVREREAYVEATVRRGEESVVLQWTHDSAYRFFPLITHEDLGLTLHPVDLATNKVLALVGRLEPRDWVDVITAHERIQPLGCLAWAACGKDPGFSPRMILEEAARSARYTAVEIAALSFAGPAPDAGDLSRRWRAALVDAQEIVALLPPEKAGHCVVDAHGEVFQGSPSELRLALGRSGLRFHEGRIRGAWPQLR